MLILLSALGLTSCSSTALDPSFKTYEAQVVSNPAPDAIIGLWQRVSIQQLPAGPLDERKSNLFRPDGTGMQKARHRIAGKDFDLPAMAFKWRHEGNGTWSTTIDNPAARYRFAGNALLYYLDTTGLKIRHVYLRAN
jgi:hypothetical protein